MCQIVLQNGVIIAVLECCGIYCVHHLARAVLSLTVSRDYQVVARFCRPIMFLSVPRCFIFSCRWHRVQDVFAPQTRVRIDPSAQDASKEDGCCRCPLECLRLLCLGTKVSLSNSQVITRCKCSNCICMFEPRRKLRFHLINYGRTL